MKEPTMIEGDQKIEIELVQLVPGTDIRTGKSFKYSSDKFNDKMIEKLIREANMIALAREDRTTRINGEIKGVLP